MKQSNEKKIAKYLRQILAWDKKYANLGWTPPMFSFFIARPNKKVLTDKRKLKEWQTQENEREAWAEQHLGTYYWEDYMEMLMNKSRLGRYIYAKVWLRLYALVKLFVLVRLSLV